MLSRIETGYIAFEFAHIAARCGAQEIINLFAMFIKTDLSVTEIKKLIFSYPTLASDISYML